MGKYTEGVCSDGAAILRDGVPMTISEILTELNVLARNKALEEAAHVIETGQETHSSDAHGDSYSLTQRRHGNMAGLAYAAAIRALKTVHQ